MADNNPNKRVCRDVDASSVANISRGSCRTSIKKTSFSYFWSIDNFFFHSKKLHGPVLQSDAFKVDVENTESVWNLELHPSGSGEKNKDSISIYLCLMAPNDVEFFTFFKMSVVNAKGERTATMISEEVIFKGEKDIWGFSPFIKRNHLKLHNDLLPDGVLTVCCDLTIISEMCTARSEQSRRLEIKAEQHLAQDLRSLLDGNLLSDVKLVVEGRDFPAHKAILVARSPVFAAMFQTDMRESKENVVKIDDVNCDIFGTVLEFIYTAKTPSADRSQRDLEFVLYAANKYGLDDLKKASEMALCEKINIENAAEILLVCDMNDAEILEKKSIQYILSHSAEVIVTEGFKLIEAGYPRLLSEVFRQSVKK